MRTTGATVWELKCLREILVLSGNHRKQPTTKISHYRAQTVDMVLKCPTITSVMQQEFVGHKRVKAVDNEQ